jgi:hypothetical protein
VSGAILFVSETGKTDNLRSRGFVLNSSASIGLSGNKPVEAVENWRNATQSRSRLILTGGYRHHEIVPDPQIEDAFLRRNRWFTGAKYSTGIPQRRQFGLEAIYQRSKYQAGASDQYLTAVASVDYRLGDSLWLSLAYGKSFGNSVAADSSFIGSTFRYAFGPR